MMVHEVFFSLAEVLNLTGFKVANHYPRYLQKMGVRVVIHLCLATGAVFCRSFPNTN